MRIDKYLAERFGSRNKAAAAISKGLVFVNGKTVSVSYEIKDFDAVTFATAEEEYVSAGGFKLSKALKDFGFSVKGKVVADIGASTGGFTDCLLQNGAGKVYCIDVGESQLHESLKGGNVVVIDNYNARNLNARLFAEIPDCVVIDVSFISLTYILDAVAAVVSNDGGDVIALIKPQFECESRSVGKNGIVKGAAEHKKIIEKIYRFAVEHGLAPLKLTNAPIRKDKNMEYLILLEKGASAESCENLLKSVKL